MSKSKSSTVYSVFGWLVAASLVVAIIAGLIMVGSPMKARDEKIDAKRLSNMQSTARVISCYAESAEGGLPNSIETIKTAVADGVHYNDPKNRRCQNLKWKTDPLTDMDFQYDRLGENSFQLCGIFERKEARRTKPADTIYNTNSRTVLNTTALRTSAGKHCYTAKNWS